ncbi:hypothetical protein HFN01_34585 [Rhizobium leguminosarum]|uniref:phospholipase D family protein n=1 Tax=Rhizobium leguminosarum TaxID=384 RepID=UPI001C96F578|nr:phospholipase D family protein [Rhizobium leguminosarum]MBY5399918.1 hypothetical protein [Rhizobium leguminosarum]
MDIILQRAETVSLRAIVGIAGWATHPSALRRFARAGQLRIPTKAPLFHPKVVLFHMPDRTIAWIGSANLTRSGYQQNLEIMFEVDRGDEVKSWFDAVWSSLPYEIGDVIDKYEQEWRPEKAFGDPIGGLAEAEPSPERLRLLPDGADWATFVEAIGTANRFWKGKDVYWTVDGEGPSWLTTINLGNSILTRGDLTDLTYLEYRILLGIEFEREHSGYGLLGSMKGAGRAKEAFNPTNGQSAKVRRRVRRLLQPVIDSGFDGFPDVASKFIGNVSDIEGFAGSVSTRLIALARPDLGVSVNAGSRAMLELYSGVPASTLSKPRRPRASGSYAALLEYLQAQPWYHSPDPRSPYEQMLASCRGALIDAIAYGYER